MYETVEINYGEDVYNQKIRRLIAEQRLGLCEYDSADFNQNWWDMIESLDETLPGNESVSAFKKNEGRLFWRVLLNGNAYRPSRTLAPHERGVQGGVPDKDIFRFNADQPWKWICPPNANSRDAGVVPVNQRNKCYYTIPPNMNFQPNINLVSDDIKYFPANWLFYRSIFIHGDGGFLTRNHQLLLLQNLTAQYGWPKIVIKFKRITNEIPNIEDYQTQGVVTAILLDEPSYKC